MYGNVETLAGRDESKTIGKNCSESRRKLCCEVNITSEEDLAKASIIIEGFQPKNTVPTIIHGRINDVLGLFRIKQF